MARTPSESATWGTGLPSSAASALLVDYVFTVAVSVVAGVAAITSASPRRAPHAVSISVGLIVLLTLVNLRGVKESGKAFALPTYGFAAIELVLLGTALVRYLLGADLQAQSATCGVRQAHETAGLLTGYLALRALASGCTALTGVEAISNGVPSFTKPKSKNAACSRSS